MKLTEKQKELLEEYTPYIKKRISFYHFIPPLEVKSATSHVLYEIAKRIHKFDKKRGTIKGFLNTVIRNLVYNYYKKHHPNINKQPDSDCDNIWTETPIEPPDVDRRTSELDYWEERKEYEIASAINELDFKDMTVINLYYYDNKTEESIGRMFGVTKQAICQQIKRAEAKLKPKIAKRLKELEDVRSEI